MDARLLVSISLLMVPLTLTACRATTTGSATPVSEHAEPAPTGAAHTEPLWEEFSPEAFARARAERRLILVSVYTQWCHWCHVMDEQTWEDPRVASLLRERFVTLRVDADARPDIADRYREWGWPATAVLTPDAEPVLHIKGYRAPEKVLASFGDIVRDLDAGREIAMRELPVEAPQQAADLAALRTRVTRQMDAYWDAEQGGWGGPKKFPLLAPVELSLRRGLLDGEPEQLQRVRFTLEQQRAIADPVWGGLYQYSTYSVWTRPHFEKLAFIQAWAIQQYVAGAAALNDPALLDVALDVRRYLNQHLRGADGAYFANQDADVGTRGERPHMDGAAFYALDEAARRAAGTPYVDESVYAFHNGVLIAALARLYAATLDDAVLDDARRAMDRLAATHRLPSGAYLHAVGDDPQRLHLADQRAMAGALLALYEVTSEAVYLSDLIALVDTTVATLRDDGAAALYAHPRDVQATGVFATRETPLRDNAVFARVLVQLTHITGDSRYREVGESIVRALARPAWLKDQRRLVGDYALAVRALLDEPVHMTVVGSGEDAATLFRATLPAWAPVRVVERQRGEGKFPDLGHAALYVCTPQFCSSPITDPGVVVDEVAGYLRP